MATPSQFDDAAQTLRRQTPVRRVAEVLLIIAVFFAIAGDPPPGHELMWRGYMLLRAMSIGFSLRDAGPDP